MAARIEFKRGDSKEVKRLSTFPKKTIEDVLS